MDLQNAPQFQDLGVELLSISPDPLEDWSEDASALGITSLVLSDPGNQVAEDYGVMRWAMPTGEPGHTFVLVDEDGTVRWIRDYGAPQNGGLMYVPVPDLLQELNNQLSA